MAETKIPFEEWFAGVRTSEGICPVTGIRGRIVGESRHFVRYVASYRGRKLKFAFNKQVLARLYRREGESAGLNYLIQKQTEAALRLGAIGDIDEVDNLLEMHLYALAARAR